MLTDHLHTHHTEPRLTPAQHRLGAGLMLASVVLLLAGFSQETSSMHGDSAEKVRSLLAEADFDRVIAGGLVESLSFLVLIPGLVFLARVVGHRTEAARWASASGLAAGVIYVAVTLAVGMPAGAAALYAAQHGAEATTVAAVVDVRNYAFFLSVAITGAQALAVGLSALADGSHTRWIGYGGVVAGIGTVAAVAAGAPNPGSLIWMVWFVGTGVALLRSASADAGEKA
jgi:uncharacterized protein DUF4386